MYKDGEAALDRILELVARCPKDLQQTCFEVLLSGYVQLEAGGPRSQSALLQVQQTPQQTSPAESQIPAAALTRFRSTAKRLGIALEKIEALFDFSVDPFALHAFTLPGKNIAQKTREVTLLAATRSYLATGSWSADWQEVKSLCIDHSCYGEQNHFVNLEKGTGKLFKGVEERLSNYRRGAYRKPKDC